MLPHFLGPLTTVMTGPARALLDGAEAGGGVAAGQSVVPNVSMIGQQLSNWCWSAVTQTVQGWAHNALDQADIATDHITHNGRAASCSPPDPDSMNNGDCAAADACQALCNDPHILSVVLGENGRLAGFITQAARPTFQQLVDELNAQRPAPCRVQWSTGGGHFIVVFGWTVDATGAQLVHVLDPERADPGQPVPEKIMPFDDFVSAYDLSGVTGEINYSYRVQ